MSITVEATYEKGTLKLPQTVSFPEGAHLRVTITPMEDDQDPLKAVIGICKGRPPDGAANHDKYPPRNLADQTFGMIGWSGDAATFDRLLKESEADRLEHP